MILDLTSLLCIFLVRGWVHLQAGTQAQSYSKIKKGYEDYDDIKKMKILEYEKYQSTMDCFTFLSINLD